MASTPSAASARPPLLPRSSSATTRGASASSTISADSASVASSHSAAHTCSQRQPYDTTL
eukprot:1186043-Prorocentrum_minimum.AAC.3